MLQALAASQARRHERGHAAAQVATAQSDLVAQIAALQETLTAVREEAAAREDELLASVARLSQQVTLGQQDTEAASVNVAEATQPLVREVADLRGQLALEEERRAAAEASLASRLSEAEGTIADLGRQLADSKLCSAARLEEIDEAAARMTLLEDARAAALAAAEDASQACAKAERERDAIKQALGDSLARHACETEVRSSFAHRKPSSQSCCGPLYLREEQCYCRPFSVQPGPGSAGPATTVGGGQQPCDAC